MIIFKTDLKELPESCTLCPYSKRYGLIGDRFCTISNEYFTGNLTPPYKERPDQCPLQNVSVLDTLKVPNTCGECKFIGHYETGPFARNPHCCCELIYQLTDEDYKVDKNSLDKNCPLKKFE